MTGFRVTVMSTRTYKQVNIPPQTCVLTVGAISDPYYQIRALHRLTS